MSFYSDLALDLAPLGMTIAAVRLRDRDANSTGIDDASALILRELAPLVPDLIKGQTGVNAADKAMLAIYMAAQTYLKSRDKLPGSETLGRGYVK